MSLAQNLYEVQEEIGKMQKSIDDLRFLEWEEIFSFVPECEGVKKEVLRAVEQLSESFEVLRKNF